MKHMNFAGTVCIIHLNGRLAPFKHYMVEPSQFKWPFSPIKWLLLPNN